MEDYKKITGYIESLYKSKEYLLQKSYVKDMEVKKYIPTVDDCTANFLRLLIKLTKPMKILEIGTSVGYSTTSMALEVKEYGGKITTIEFDENVAAQAEQNFKAAGVDNTITLLKGDAMDIVAKLDGEYDMIFQDVDKRLYAKLLPDCIKLLKKGGTLISDDALFPVLDMDEKWNYLIKPVKDYNEQIMKCQELDSVLLPIEDGMMFSVKL